jgi:cytosine/adenosine deaminase-related metal-dependent hydrolase
MDERLASQQRGRFTAGELLTAAANHAALGWSAAGAIAVGNRADLVAVSLDSVRTAGVDPGQAVFAATAADVTHVVADGRLIVADGRHTGFDVASALRAAVIP